MKGKTLVIGIIVFVVLIVATIYFMMMATINNIKEEQGLSLQQSVVIVEDIKFHHN